MKEKRAAGCEAVGEFGGEIDETKAVRFPSLSLSCPVISICPLTLLPIHHISFTPWAGQLSVGAGACSQFSSPSNWTKYCNSLVRLWEGLVGGERCQELRAVLLNPLSPDPIDWVTLYPGSVVIWRHVTCAIQIYYFFCISDVLKLI